MSKHKLTIVFVPLSTAMRVMTTTRILLRIPPLQTTALLLDYWINLINATARVVRIWLFSLPYHEYLVLRLKIWKEQGIILIIQRSRLWHIIVWMYHGRAGLSQDWCLYPPLSPTTPTFTWTPISIINNHKSNSPSWPPPILCYCR